jgi:hypothetical protein
MSVEETIHTTGRSRGVDASKSAEAKALPEKSESTQTLEILSSEHLEPLPLLPGSSASTT